MLYAYIFFYFLTLSINRRFNAVYTVLVVWAFKFVHR